MSSSSDSNIPNDPNVVRRHYATDAYMRIRQEIHEKYTYPQIDFADWVLSNIRWKGGESILDVGCGNGQYYYPLQYYAPEGDNVQPFQYYGVDVSHGVMRSHPAWGNGKLAVGDALALPFANHSFDVVMANHMLFYVSDIDQAIGEFRRVMKPGGALLVATNSIHSMSSVQTLLRKAVILLSRKGGAQAPASHSDLFALENGLLWLKRYFYAVMRCDLPSVLVLNTIDPLMDFLESTRDLREAQLPPDVAWDDVMTVVRQQLTHLINSYGEIGIEKLSGVLVATDSGDFVHEFLAKQSGASTPE